LSVGIYGYQVESDVALSRLRRGCMPRGRIRIEGSNSSLLEQPAEIVQLVDSPDSGEILFAIARESHSLVAWCAASGEYRVDAGVGTIDASPSGEPEDLEDRLLNALIPLLLIERGELVLHGSAVMTKAGAIVVSGPSGRGKSTLGAALSARGLPVLAEDAVAVSVSDGKARLWPGPTGVRLDPSTSAALEAFSTPAPVVRGKHLHALGRGRVDGDPVPLAAIVCLEPREGAQLSLRPMHDASALANVFLNVFRLERERWPGVLRRTAELVRSVSCYRASMPDGLELLGDAGAELVQAVGESGESLRAA
jgi:hypothetical protein